MHQDLKALSTREKEALRLLLAGHDAKSIARSLGLSVHTVNEHLRDARRKLGVSSSREAARLMASGEQEDPHLFGDKKLGVIVPVPNLFGDRRIGVAQATHLAQFNQASKHWTVGLPIAGLVGGMLLMSVFMAGLMFSQGMTNASEMPQSAIPSPALQSESMNLMPFADTNRDGKVTADEYTAFSEQGWGFVAHDGSEVNFADLDKSAQVAFLGVIPNKHGVITRQMYIEAIPARFKMLDRNRDGTLDADELNGRSFQ